MENIAPVQKICRFLYFSIIVTRYHFIRFNPIIVWFIKINNF